VGRVAAGRLVREPHAEKETRVSRPNWFLALIATCGLAGCGGLLDPGEPGNLVPRTVDEDATLPHLDLNGTRFHLETFGDPANPALVFVHGGPGGDYRSLLRLKESYDRPALTEKYFVIFWDQRGSGLSRRHDQAALKIDVFVADLGALADRFSPQAPVILVGESWGGMFATEFINRYPTRVRGAVLIEPGPLTGSRMERIKDDMFTLDLGAEWMNDYAWSQQFLSPDDHARMDYQRMLGYRQAQPKFHQSFDVDPSPSWRLGAAASRYIQEDGQDADGKFVYDFTTHLDAFDKPVRFIASGWNEVLGEEFQREQMTSYERADLRVVPQVGHDLSWVKPAETLGWIHEYLEQLEAEGSLP
jgi:proline iminopeptidase